MQKRRYSNSQFEVSLRAPDAFPGATLAPALQVQVSNLHSRREIASSQKNAPRNDILRIADADTEEIEALPLRVKPSSTSKREFVPEGFYGLLDLAAHAGEDVLWTGAKLSRQAGRSRF